MDDRKPPNSPRYVHTAKYSLLCSTFLNWPLSFLLPPHEGQQGYHPFPHPQGPLLAWGSGSAGTVACSLAGSRIEEPHSAQSTSWPQSQSLSGSNSPGLQRAYLLYLRSSPLPTLRMGRAHRPSRMDLQATVQPKSPDAAPQEVRHPMSNPGDSEVPTGPLPTPHAALHVAVFLTQRCSAEWAQAGGEGPCSPSATS